MGLRAAGLLIVVLLIAALAVLNWGELTTSSMVSIGFMQVSAPLGAIMLGLTTLLGLFAVIYIFYLQSTVLLESRRHAKEIREQRELADKAEASRFTELRQFLTAQDEARTVQETSQQDALLARLDQLDNTVAAQIGQLEDRLDRR